jgi:acyl-CoA thioesterase I
MNRIATLSAAAAALAASFFATLPAPAQAGWSKPTMQRPDPALLARLDTTLPHVAARLAERQSLKIVALGSSSTEGIGASAPDKCYPARLNALLRARYPDIDIVVKNHGVSGEDAQDMLARLDRVIAEKPDLVVWQVGTNAILNHFNRAEQERLMRIGLARLMASGADVVLIDPQYVPQTANKPGTAVMVELIERLARESGIGVFRRFAIMRHWSKVQHIPFGTFTSRDGLHMNDWSYDRVAELLADAITEASLRPVRTVRARVAGKARS